MISIITPSFNQSAWLRLAVASVADQAGVEHEHIVQDSLSHDGTHDWLAQATGVQAVFEKDSGMYDAINRGLRRAKGEICAYLNCDEQYLPETLAKVAAFFRDHPKAEILFGDFVLIDQEFRILSYRRIVVPTKRHTRLAHLNTATCAMFFRRSLLDRGFYFDPQYQAVGDGIWVGHLLEAGVHMATLPEPLSVFTFTGSNLGSAPASRREAATDIARHHLSRALERATTIAWHRCRKALAGAYRRREILIEIYTLDSPARRLRIHAPKVGYHWPEPGEG